VSILVLGATGQLGSHLKDRLPQAAFWGRERLDLTDATAVREMLCAAAPSVIVNAAAHTAVDRAEQEPDLAWRINADAPAAMALAAAALDVPLVHVSTDFVFDGSSSRPYTEADGARPINVYGRTKLAGELAVASLCDQHYILRTSWVFGEYGSNFVKTMLRLANERDTLHVVDDQRGRPSYAGDLAALIAALVERLSRPSASARADTPLPGTYHTGGGPEATWCSFARDIFARASTAGLISKVPQVIAIPTSDYPTPAARPLNSSLVPNRAFQSMLGVDPDWLRGLDTTLAKLATRLEQDA
jgi:dTDP-4-dehydrorhamnose reductase